MCLAFAPGTGAGDAVEVVKPALTTLDKSVIGSVLIVCLVLAVAAVVQLIRVQNARVADQKAMSEKSEKLIAKMVTAFTEMKGALESLKKSEESSQTMTEALKNSIESLQQTFNLFLISQGRRYTPPSGISTEQVQKELEHKKRGG